MHLVHFVDLFKNKMYYKLRILNYFSAIKLREQWIFVISDDCESISLEARYSFKSKDH